MPGQPELALGAVSEDGRVVLNLTEEEALALPKELLAEERDFQMTLLAPLRKLLRAVRPPAQVADRSVIVTDDGIATGSTMTATPASPLRAAGGDGSGQRRNASDRIHFHDGIVFGVVRLAVGEAMGQSAASPRRSRGRRGCFVALNMKKPGCWNYIRATEEKLAFKHVLGTASRRAGQGATKPYDESS
jgi:hypothetical protein